MENEIIIRPANPNDLKTLLGFEQGIILAERPFDETLKEGEIHYYDIAAMIEDEDTEVVVAEVNGNIIASGYARIEVSKLYLKHRYHAFLGFMYVHPEYRGKGINRQIVEQLAQFAKARGVTELQLDVYADNEPAIKAYEKAGFTKYLVSMRKEV